MKKIAKFGVVALLLVSLVGSAIAFGGFGKESREALDKGSYAEWKEAMSNGLTEERFNQMKERHDQNYEKRAEMLEAMEQGYDAWKEKVSDCPRGRMTEVVNEDNFDTFVKMHQAKQEGDFETAKELADELGLGFGHKKSFR